jgi:hypothetical protein
MHFGEALDVVCHRTMALGGGGDLLKWQRSVLSIWSHRLFFVFKKLCILDISLFTYGALKRQLTALCYPPYHFFNMFYHIFVRLSDLNK